MKVFDSLTAEQINNFALIKGHLANHFSSKVSGDRKTIVFVREPKDLFLSSYYYIQRAEHNAHHDLVKDMTLDEFIKYRENQNWHNSQSKHLCGYTDLRGRGALTEVSRDVLKEEVINKVSTIQYVFTTSYFDEALMLLHKELGWERKPYYSRKNKTKKRPSLSTLSSDQLVQIQNLTDIDQTLYEMVVKQCALKFDQKLLKASKKFSTENKIYSNFSSLYRKITQSIKL